jgi:hypothetical protein
MEADLIAAIAACESDLQRGEDNLVRMKAALRSLQRERRAAESEEANPNGQRKRGAKTSRSVSDAKVIRSFAREELRKVGHPLNRAEIAERLANSGIAISAKVPLDRVAKVMWLAKEFQNVGDGYWFAGEPVPSSE